ncbi:MAG: hypothetical protein PWP09_1175 [Thermotogota bacterium]|nr:hypothetical protein [Thermotogota bacterium]
MRFKKAAAVIFVMLFLAVLGIAGSSERIPYFLATHSHNDYLQPRPLLEALESGMASVEADVYYVELVFRDDKGKERVMKNLYVAHDWESIEGTSPYWNTCGTLQYAYLDLLREIYYERGGMIYPNRPLLLHVDFKTDVEKTWRFLQNILRSYPEGLFTRFDQVNRVVIPGAVTVYTSHEPGLKVLAEYPVLWSTVDGRFGDIYDPKTWESKEYLDKRWRIVVVSSNIRAYNDEKKFWHFIVPQEEIIKEYGGRYPTLAGDFWGTLRANNWALANELVETGKIEVSDYLVEQMRKANELGKKYGHLMRFWAPPDAPYFWEILAPLENVVILTDHPRALANWLEANGYRIHP